MTMSWLAHDPSDLRLQKDYAENYVKAEKAKRQDGYSKPQA